MFDALSVTRVQRSRLTDVDYDNLGFGAVFSDHMFSMPFADGAWGAAEILPYGPLAINPGNATLQYGMAVFEGLKAFRGVDGAIRVFRPGMNDRRLRTSCERLCIPPLPEGAFEHAIDALLQCDHAWIPSRRGHALYIRPIIFSDEDHLDVRPSQRFRFVVMTGPVRAYFDENAGAVALKAEDVYTRSAPGGVGEAKTAGNYAASMYPAKLARDQGYAQVLWLDGVEHRYVEEVGAMNIFFRIHDTIVTPDLRGTILPGITRDSVIQLLTDQGHRVEERRISIDEVTATIADGSMKEAFAAGTAAIISPVGKIAYRGKQWLINDNKMGSITQDLYNRITGIQLGEREDSHGWNRVLHIPQATQAAPVAARA